MYDNVRKPYYYYCPGCGAILDYSYDKGKYRIDCTNPECAAGASSDTGYIAAYNRLLAWIAMNIT